jgi:hypothetical protein
MRAEPARETGEKISAKARAVRRRRARQSCALDDALITEFVSVPVTHNHLKLWLRRLVSLLPGAKLVFQRCGQLCSAMQNPPGMTGGLTERGDAGVIRGPRAFR